MREMKDSGVEWIGEIPQNKSLLRNKYKLSYIKGKLPTTTNIEGKGSPYIGASDLDCMYENYTTFTEDNELPETDGTDLLVLWDGARAGLPGTKKKGKISSTIVKIVCDNSIYKPFLYWYYKGFESYMYDMVNGTTIPHMNKKYIEDIRFIDWSIEEQKQMADYLDNKCAKIDSIIEKQQAIIEKLKEYKISVITEAVTKGLNPDVEMKDSGIKWIGDMPTHWQRGRLSDVTDRIIVGLATSVTPYYRPSGMVLLRNLNIKEGHLDDTELLYLDEEFANSQIGKYIEKDDVLTVHTGSNLGLTCVVPDKYEHTLSFTTLITTPTKEKLDSFYLMYTINSGLGKSEIDKLKCGDIKPNLNVGQFKYFTVFIPPIEEQKKIVSFLNKRSQEIDNDILVKEQVIKKLNEYKKSLIYEVVTGKKEV